MSAFTHASLFMPIVTGPRSGGWRAGQAYKFFEQSDMTGPSIDIEIDDESNGADMPPAWAVCIAVTLALCLFAGVRDALIVGLLVTALMSWLLPKVHAEYIAAVFVHDVGLKKFRHIFSRRRIDRMFLKALSLERRPITPRPSEFKNMLTWILLDVPHWLWRLVRPYLMFAGVSLWGVVKERQKYFQTANASNHISSL